MMDAEKEFRKMRGEVPHRPDLENRIRELENEVASLKGKIEGMQSVPLPVQPVYEGQRFCPPVPSTKKSWEPPWKITCTTGSSSPVRVKPPYEVTCKIDPNAPTIR